MMRFSLILRKRCDFRGYFGFFYIAATWATHRCGGPGAISALPAHPVTCQPTLGASFR